MKLYITDLSLFVLIFFYLPFVLWVLWRLWRTPRLLGVKKGGGMVLTALLAYLIPLGDVTINSLAMAKVCPSAGMHIYKTVEVEGFIGRYSLSDVPYRFIEFPKQRIDDTYYWIRYERNPDGNISETYLEKPTAEYEVLDGQWHVDDSRGVEASTYVIRNRMSGEILAERNLFNPLPGWLDKTLVVRWFGVGGRHGCWGEPSAGISEFKVLLPKHLN